MQPRSTREILNVCVQLAFENLHDINLKIVELLEEHIDPEESVLSSMLVEILEDIPTVQVKV